MMVRGGQMQANTPNQARQVLALLSRYFDFSLALEKHDFKNYPETALREAELETGLTRDKILELSRLDLRAMAERAIFLLGDLDEEVIAYIRRGLPGRN